MRDPPSSQTDPANTKEAAPAWYVLLGRGETSKTQTKPRAPGGRGDKAFPVIFKVPREDIADDILAYREAIKEIEAISSVYDRVHRVLTHPIGDDVLEALISESKWKGVYPVAYGRECMVFSEYPDAIDATKDFHKSIWKKVPDFRRALAFMISNGETEKRNGDANLRQLVADYIDTLYATPVQGEHAESRAVHDAPPSLALGAMRLGSRLPGSSPPCTPPRRSAQISSPLATPARPAHERHTGSGTPPRPDYTSPPLSPPRSISPLLTELVFDLALADVKVSDVVYQHTRNLQGIKGTHTFPQVNITKVTSCGPALDTYLQALGYDIDSKLTVAHACMSSTRVEDFVRRLIEYGLPILEAKYMWVLYTTSPPSASQWSETHIM